MISLKARVRTKEGMVCTCYAVVHCSMSSLRCAPFAADAVTVFR